MPKSKPFENVPIKRIEANVNSEIKSSFEISKLKEEDDNNVEFVIEPHRHDFYHMMFINKGEGKHHIDFKTYDIKPKSIFFVSPGQVHALEASSDVEGYVISFNVDFYYLNNTIQTRSDFPFYHTLNNAPVVYLSQDNVKIKENWDELYTEYNSPDSGSDKMISALFEVLLMRILRVYLEQPLQNNQTVYLTERLRQLETLIDIHFKEYKLVNDYAELMHTSPKHLNSLCKETLNKTVTNLIHERLLIEAKRLLLFTTNSITEIGYELGFTDKSYFMRFFKRHVGLTAETYRKQNK